MRTPALAPFGFRSFRFQWPADLAVSWAFEMETLILGWYVLAETGSVRLLVLFGALQYAGALISPMFGVAADRIGHRDLLCITRAIYAVMAATLLALIVSGTLTPVLVLAIAGCVGLIRPSDMMMRNTLIAQSLPAAQLMGALGLSRITTDSARVAGALAGAGAVAALGMGPAYLVILGMYAISCGLTLGISRTPASSAARVARAPTSPWSDLRQVLGYVWSKPELLAAMGIAFFANLLAYPFVMGLLPYVARDVYGIGQAGLGILAASFAIGGLVGSIVVSANRTPLRPARTMLLAAGSWFLATLAFAHTRSLATGAVALLLIGFAQTLCMVPLLAVMLRSSDEEIRGRVMGMRMLAVWGLPIGLLLSGPAIAGMGFALTATLYSLIGLTITLLIALRWRTHLWRHAALANARL